MKYLLFFLEVLWNTLGVMIACGLCVALCRFLFTFFLGGNAGYYIIMATSIVGTPVHELGHALFCLIFGHKITDIALWTPHAENGSLGHVSHSYNRRNPIQVWGNLFIGLGPIFSGLLVLSLLLLLCFPEATKEYAASVPGMISAGWDFAIIPEIAKQTVLSLVHELGHGRMPLWVQIIGLLIMLSVSLHVSISPADMKNAAGALPLTLGVLVVFAGIVSIVDLCGVPAVDTIATGLRLFGTAQFALFTVVLLFSAAQAALALAVWLLRLLLEVIFS